MSNANSMRCPNCNYPLSCGYYGGTTYGRVIQCERCGLRGPESESVDDGVDAPLALFAAHCTAKAANEQIGRLQTEIKRLRAAVITIRGLCESMPCGYDVSADLNDRSPEDASAHTTGLIVQTCEEALKCDGSS